MVRIIYPSASGAQAPPKLPTRPTATWANLKVARPRHTHDHFVLSSYKCLFASYHTEPRGRSTDIYYSLITIIRFRTWCRLLICYLNSNRNTCSSLTSSTITKFAAQSLICIKRCSKSFRHMSGRWYSQAGFQSKVMTKTCPTSAFHRISSNSSPTRIAVK
jgi:hypothetical protein